MYFVSYSYGKQGLCKDYGDDMGVTSSGKYMTASEACCECKGDSSATHVADHTPAPETTPAPGPSTGTILVASGSAGDLWVKAHNTRRSEWGGKWGLELNNVKWNADLAAQAQVWATYLLEKKCGGLEHVSENCLKGCGENLAYNQIAPDKAVTNIEEVLERWTEKEIAGDPAKAGHASQVLWKGTKDIGCADAVGQCSDGFNTAVQVCRYFPSGNFNCDGHCIDSVKKNAMSIDDRFKAIPAITKQNSCIKGEIPNFTA